MHKELSPNPNVRKRNRTPTLSLKAILIESSYLLQQHMKIENYLQVLTIEATFIVFIF